MNNEKAAMIYCHMIPMNSRIDHGKDSFVSTEIPSKNDRVVFLLTTMQELR